jgi:hypothetical protein
VESGERAAQKRLHYSTVMYQLSRCEPDDVPFKFSAALREGTLTFSTSQWSCLHITNTYATHRCRAGKQSAEEAEVRPTIGFAHFPPTTLSRTLSTANAALGLRGLVVSSCTQITANDVIPGLCNRTAGFSFYDAPKLETEQTP